MVRGEEEVHREGEVLAAGVHFEGEVGPALHQQAVGIGLWIELVDQGSAGEVVVSHQDGGECLLS